jgi:4-hydroxy-tetrahydrodipicolinate reductase
MSDVRVAIAGACGRMGHALINCASKTEGVSVVGAVECDGHPSIGQDAGEVAGIGAIGVKVVSDLASVLPDCDVLIDFTLHEAVPGNAIAAEAAGKAVVLGTTGLSDEEAAIVNKCAEKIPFVWAPNMSLGVNVLFAAVKKAASVFGADYAVEVDETHHIHKKDAPSGTALRLGEKVAEGLGVDFAESMVHDPNGEQGIKDPAKIVMRSYREGEVAGIHTVSFESDAEKIEFTHHLCGREALAAGALRASQWVTAQGPGMYDMQAVLDL